MFGRYGRFVVSHPWLVIIGWLVAAAAAITFSPRISDITSADQGSFLPDSYESIRAINVAREAFPQEGNTTSVFVVVKRADGGPLTEADQAKVAEVAQTLQSRGINRVSAVVTGPQAVAPNRTVQLINVVMEISGNPGADPELFQAVRNLRTELQPAIANSGLTAGVAGDIAAFVDNESTFNNALAIVGIATFVLIIGLVLLIFRSPIAALLPIVVISIVLQVTTSLVALAGSIFNFNVTQDLQTILLIVLFGIGTDYILFLLFRYRERLRAGDDKKTAMVVAIQRVGEVITSAAAAVIVAFLVLLLASFGAFGSLGPALAIAVAVMLVTALTLIPALVSLLGRFTFGRRRHGSASRRGPSPLGWAAPSVAGPRSWRWRLVGYSWLWPRACCSSRPTTTSAPAFRRTPSPRGPPPTCAAASLRVRSPPPTCTCAAPTGRHCPQRRQHGSSRRYRALQASARSCRLNPTPTRRWPR